MASNIPIRDIPTSGTPSGSSYIVFDDGQMKKGTVADLADGVRPVASQSEAQDGDNNTKTMTPLRVKDSIASEVGVSVASKAQGDLANTAVQPGDLGSAAFSDTTDFATAAQGATADSAVQPGDLATVATSGSYADLSGKPYTVPAGGTTGQVLAKNSNTDGDTEWITNSGGSSLILNVMDFGAKGDMRLTIDGAMTASSTTFTSATAAFTSADVGKKVRVAGAGAPTASGATTNAAGYAIGARIINLAASGSGSIVAGNGIKFAGDTNVYTVAAGGGLANVASGGAITLNAPGLLTAISASATAVTTVVDLYTTVSSVTNGTTAILTNAASTTVSSAFFRIATDDTAAIQAAVAAAQFNALFFPTGKYFVEASSGTEIFLVEKPTRFIGELGGYDGAWIATSKRTPDTVDMFQVKPDQVSSPFIEFSHLCIATEVPDGYEGGANAIHLVTDASTQLQRLDINNCWINGGTGWGIRSEDTDVTVSTAAFYQSVIAKNVIRGTFGAIGLTQAGDTISIKDNAFSGFGRGIYITPVSGAAMQVIENNGFQNMEIGAIFLENCSQTKIRDNQIEQATTYFGPEGGMVALKNCHDCEITGNNLNGFDKISPLILFGGTTRTRIKGNTFAVNSSALKHVTISSDAGNLNVISATNTYIVGGAVGAALVSNSSTVPQIGLMTQLSLLNSWVGGGFTDHDGLFYRVNEDDTVSLNGNIKNGTNAPLTNLALLPVGARPSVYCYALVYSGSNSVGLLFIDPSGNIGIGGDALPNNTAVRFMECRFPLLQ